MNAKSCLLAAAVLVLAAGAQAQRMDLNQVPPAVRARIDASREKGAPKNIVRHTENGRAVYDVEFERNNAPNPRMRFAEDGTVLDDIPPLVGMEEGWMLSKAYPDGAPMRSTIRLADLPGPVRETAQREAKGREIVDIDQERWDNRAVYEIEFGERGRNPQIHVAEDGTVVQDKRPRQGLKTLFLGTQIQDTPPAVQETIRRLTEDREIIDIDKRGTKERPIYRVTARRSGVSYEVLNIAEDGKVISGLPPARG